MDKPRTIDDLLTVAGEYLHEEKHINIIKKAYEVAASKHCPMCATSGRHPRPPK